MCVVAAYGLNSYQKLRSDAPAFYIINLVGGVLLIVYALHKTAYANLFINAVWVIIALPPLFRVLRKRVKP